MKENVIRFHRSRGPINWRALGSWLVIGVLLLGAVACFPTACVLWVLGLV